MSIEQMVSTFLCPGCINGSNTTSCSKVAISTDSYGNNWCKNHAAGTMMFPGGEIFLGMPNGFNKVPFPTGNIDINLHENGNNISYNALNIPLWYTVQDDYLIIKVASPRINSYYIDVIKGMKPEDIPTKYKTISFQNVTLPDIKDHRPFDITGTDID